MGNNFDEDLRLRLAFITEELLGAAKIELSGPENKTAEKMPTACLQVMPRSHYCPSFEHSFEDQQTARSTSTFAA